MLKSDSPFPPLKSEHRYRGVYERAGFDVNLKHGSPQSPNDIKSLSSRKPQSPFKQGFSFSKPGSSSASRDTSRNPSLQNLASERNEDSLSSSNREKFSSPKNATSFSNSVPASREPTHDLPPSTNAESRPFHHANTPYAPFKPFLPEMQHSNSSASLEKKNRNLNHANDSAELFQRQPERTPSSESRNVKNLSLKIPESNQSTSQFKPDTTFSGNTTAGMISELEANSPTFDRVGDRSSTPNTSASSSTEFRKASTDSGISVKTSELTNAPYPTGNENLSTMLDEFKNDVEEHKKYDPRQKGMGASTTSPTNNVTLFKPATGDLSNTFNKAVLGIHEPSQAEGQNQEIVHKQEDNDDDVEANDYKTFLQTSAAGGDNQKRKSNFSTISSIISKDNDAEEIDPELQRELDMLKSGEQKPVKRASQEKPASSDDSFVTAHSDVPERAARQAAHPVPLFNIQDVSSATEEEERSTDKEDATEDGDTTPKFHQGSGYFDKLDSHPAENVQQSPSEETEPLSFNRSMASDTHAPENSNIISKAPETPYSEACRFEDNLLSEGTPETIKPLSPKTHKVEEELKNMNFHNPRLEKLSQAQPSASQHHHHDDDAILLRNRPPTEFNPFPKSVIGDGYPKFRDSDLPLRNPPGHGRCRKCDEEVHCDAKGPQKAVFSKTGELSGQWHRGCFSCAYDGCSVKFNKHVACYVLLDNAFCHHHYHLLNGTMCLSCNQGIEGECIENELKQKWHLNCLQCSRCSNNINKDYYLINGDIVCEKDAGTMIEKMRDQGMLDTSKIEKRRTRMMVIDQDY